jgi:hypothetical protein
VGTQAEICRKVTLHGGKFAPFFCGKDRRAAGNLTKHRNCLFRKGRKVIKAPKIHAAPSHKRRWGSAKGGSKLFHLFGRDIGNSAVFVAVYGLARSAKGLRQLVKSQLSLFSQ